MDNTQKFLKVISQIESSGGKNTKHKPLKEGMHAGTSAFGQYGLLPNTVNEIGRRLTSLHKTDEDTAPLAILPTQEVNGYLEQHPQAEQKAAEFLARNLLARMHGNEAQSALAWHSGSSLTPEQIVPQQLQNDPYVQKYQALRKIMGY